MAVLASPGETIALSEIRSGFPARNLTDEKKAAKGAAEEAERSRLATAEGRVCFDLFAPYVGDILHDSERISRLAAAMYPVIILDEFQDTNAEQWRVVQALGACCRLIALADPEQRIYDWIGADPARLDHFRETFVPTEVDLSQPPAGMTEVPHSAVIEMEAAILGAEIIAFLMQPATDDRHFAQFIDLMCNYFQGKSGDEPTQGALREAAKIRKAFDEWLAHQAAGKAIRKNSILANTLAVYKQTRAFVFTGDPDKDWRAMRRTLEDGACKRLKKVAEEVRNIRILARGVQLRPALSQDWRDNGGYFNALSITQQAFMQEHFATNAKSETGVVVMNMHKAKGKQFDEVIIFEGWPIKRKGQPPYNADRIVRFNSRDQIDNQARQNFRVSVTRARRQTTILTPKCDRCVLLVS